jgi:hypothetical protein
MIHRLAGGVDPARRRDAPEVKCDRVVYLQNRQPHRFAIRIDAEPTAEGQRPLLE